MSNQTGFFAYCRGCGAMLRSEKRLENHQKHRCNKLIWRVKKKPSENKPPRG
jgi:hypothetical protein